ncbi:MAG: hypothetical protein ACXW3X_16400, partial [Rhodoplanes sp.]
MSRHLLNAQIGIGGHGVVQEKSPSPWWGRTASEAPWQGRADSRHTSPSPRKRGEGRGEGQFNTDPP